MTTAGYLVERDSRGLTKREREVLLALISGKTQMEIGPLLGVTKQRVTQLVRSLEDKGVIARNEDGTFTVTVKSVGPKR
jgi:DNA-binding CsgD family transcriptional regulator